MSLLSPFLFSTDPHCRVPSVSGATLPIIAGQTLSLGIVANTEPGANEKITVAMISANSSVASANSTELVFTKSNWMDMQTTTVTAKAVEHLTASGVLLLNVTAADPSKPTITSQLYVGVIDVNTLLRVSAANASQNFFVPGAFGVSFRVSLDMAVDVDTNVTVSLGGFMPFDVIVSPSVINFPAGSPAGSFALVEIFLGTVQPGFDDAPLSPLDIQATVVQSPHPGADHPVPRILPLTGLLTVNVISVEDFLRLQSGWCVFLSLIH